MPIFLMVLALFFPFNLNNNVYKENPVIRNVHAEGQNGRYLIMGETKAGDYYYTVEDGHNQYIPEKQFRNREQGWSSFNIQLKLSKTSLPKNGTLILHLYQRNQNKTIHNSYPVVLDRFP